MCIENFDSKLSKNVQPLFLVILEPGPDKSKVPDNPGRKKYHLTLHEKVGILDFLERNPKMSMRQISTAVGASLNRTISKTAISSIMKKRDEIIDNAKENPNSVRLKRKQPELELISP